MDKLIVLNLIKETVPSENAVPVSYSKLLDISGLDDENLSQILIDLEKHRYINTWSIGKDEFKLQITQKGRDAAQDADLSEEEI